jgi:hypothetical protein
LKEAGEENMKYRTKVDIPANDVIIKKGSVIDLDSDGVYLYFVGDECVMFWEHELVESHPEFFEPIQEPRWTDEDMRDYALFDQSQGFQSTLISLEKFKKWKGLS